MKRVLLLHTGGTLGMSGSPLEPDAYSQALTEAVPEITELAEVDARIVYNLDSSDIGPRHWTELAEIIAEVHNAYDGFVIVHGTDTMAYTASALSFALEGLEKPVIATGAQRPLSALRTDARRNLADAVELATRDIPEVGICFDGLLLRGSCSTKSNARDYRAFDSPGIAPLARLGVDVDVAEHVRRSDGPFSPDARFDDSVIAVHVTPGFRPDLLEATLRADDPPRGIVLAAFGAGTVPTEHSSIVALVERAIDHDVEVLVITQAYGAVDLSLYENSRMLAEAGAVSGGRMTVEAAVPKLMHALAAHPDRDDRRAYLQRNVAGELG
ncbi:MAG: asparaginase [Persicimonas sp.]